MHVRVVVVSVLVGLLAVPAAASAHGTMSDPVSRVLSCYTGYDNPENPATASCQAAKAVTGSAQAFYDWNEVNLPSPAGRHRELIPDGKLCSAGRDKYAGLDLPRADWRATTLVAGAARTFRFRVSAPHPGSFSLYVTRDGYDPLQPLAWADLEPAPFATIVNPAIVDGAYQFTATPPAGKTGRHLIYTIWQRSDSPEAFYSCSDVVFGQDTTPSDTIAPTAPTDLRAETVGQTSVSLAWTASSDDRGVAGYDVYSAGVRVATSTTTTASVTGLTADTAYSFTVRAHDAAGNESPAGTALAIRTSPPSPVDTTAPTVPLDVHRMSATPTSAELMWTASTDDVGVVGYDVYAGGSKVAASTSAMATVGGLTPDTVYQFTVRARDAAGNVSATSAPVEVRTPPRDAVTTCATFTKTSEWDGGYVGQFTVRNPAATAITGWSFSFTLPASTVITGSWSGVLTRTDSTVVVTPESWTSSIPAGGSVTFGFQVTGNGVPDCAGCCGG
jgi:chitin-binding protein